jgi:uncharacterized OsmC-like protein
MTEATVKMEFRVSAKRLDAHGSVAECKDASIILDTDMAGRRDAFNPAELLLAALGACMVKGIERVVPILKLKVRSVDTNVRQYGTVFNTVAPGTQLTGTLRRT